MRGLVLVFLLLSSCRGLQSTTKLRVTIPTAQQLFSVSLQHTAILDGAEWASVQAFTNKKVDTTTKCGAMVVVTGKTNDGRRVVGIQSNEDGVPLSNTISLYPQSVANIPSHISDIDAATTLQGALAGVHCVMPKWRVGGSEQEDEGIVNGKVVIMGGSDYACFCAQGLATLGAEVHLVSTKSPKVPKTIQCMAPAVNDVGFSSILTSFDVLLDTLSDEVGENGQPSGVLELLSKRHLCHRYVSTLTASQKIIRDRGILFGPKQAQEEMERRVASQGAVPIVPPLHFGKTVETLLANKIVYKIPTTGSSKETTTIRTWNLPDFWELASWPRDSSGGANVRFGLPVMDDAGYDFLEQEREEQDDEDVRVRRVVTVDDANPFVTSIVGLEGLQRCVVDAKQTCLVFLSAPFCKTCRSLGPAYNRMARLRNDELLFVKAETTGLTGKRLGKALDVEAVPAFVLFKNGERYGTPVSVTRIPSPKLTLALELLTSGKEWDSAAFAKLEEDSTPNK